MSFITHDGLAFHYHAYGTGTPFIFQHGLGGDVNQPFGLFIPPPGFRLLAFDCRGHGETRPLGDQEKIGFASFADDMLALLNELEVPRAIVGGISMGAGVALNFTLRFPDRVLGLVLSRPAWLDHPLPKNVWIFTFIAQLIRQHGATHGRELFMQSEPYIDVAGYAADAANSLIGQFEHPRAEETVVRLERMPRDAPSYDRREWSSIKVPTLALANRQDPIHPFEYGETLARAIPGAEFKEVTSKSVNKERHAMEVQAFIEEFLRRHFSNDSKPLS